MDPPWPSSEEEAEGGEGLPRQPVGSLVPQPLGAEVFRFRLLVHFVCSRRAGVRWVSPSLSHLPMSRLNKPQKHMASGKV